MAQKVTEEVHILAKDKTKAAVDSAANNLKRLDKEMMRTGDAMRTMTRQNRAYMGQFGHQIQDVAVQLQMGMNPMMVLGQQGSQIAAIFGPGGAVLGAVLAVAAAVGGSLAPNLMAAGREAGQFHDDIVAAAGGVDKLTEAQRRLAELDLQLRINEQQAAVANAKLAIDNYNKSIDDALKQHEQNPFGYAEDIVFSNEEMTGFKQTLELANAQLAVTQAQMDQLTGKTAEAEKAVRSLKLAFDADIETEQKRIDMLMAARSPQEKFLAGLREIRRVLGDPQTPLEVEAYRIEVEKLADKYFKAGENADKFGEKTKKLKEDSSEANKALKKLTDDALKGIEDQFVNLITGSKSVSASFKDMARSVVESLIRMQIQANITRPLAAMMPSMFSAFQAPFIAGQTQSGLIQAGGPFANGGLMPGGKVSLVGERGPELVIPNRNSTVVSNEQLQGLGGGDVNVTLNISTGVAQTVRTEIAQLMPQIAAVTKQAVADSRRRGGSFAAAFGG